jgi:hypothetical protein
MHNEWAIITGTDVGTADDWALNDFYVALINTYGFTAAWQANEQFYYNMTVDERVAGFEPLIDFANEPGAGFLELVVDFARVIHNVYPGYPGSISPPEPGA